MRTINLVKTNTQETKSIPLIKTVKFPEPRVIFPFNTPVKSLPVKSVDLIRREEKKAVIIESPSINEQKSPVSAPVIETENKLSGTGIKPIQEVVVKNDTMAATPTTKFTSTPIPLTNPNPIQVLGGPVAGGVVKNNQIVTSPNTKGQGIWKDIIGSAGTILSDVLKNRDIEVKTPTTFKVPGTTGDEFSFGEQKKDSSVMLILVGIVLFLMFKR